MSDIKLGSKYKINVKDNPKLNGRIFVPDHYSEVTGQYYGQIIGRKKMPAFYFSADELEHIADPVGTYVVDGLDDMLKKELRVSIKLLLEHLYVRGYHDDDPANYAIMVDCFKRAGWIKPAINIFGQFQAPPTRAQKEISETAFANAHPFTELMTGQEWYGKFEAELNKYTSISLQTDKGEITNLVGRSTVAMAAKKAAGVE